MSEQFVLIVAQSARALAGSARRAGYRPLVADLFADADTQAVSERCVVVGSWRHGFRRRPLLAALQALAGDETPVGVVCGSGFEDRPALLAAVGARYPLLGNSAETVSRTKDPTGFADLCRSHDVAHPQTAMRLPPGAQAADWLVKRTGGAGGAHIGGARAQPAPRRGRYVQRRVDGRPVSALFLGNGRAAAVLGFSAQWADPLPRRPYRYGGAVRPAALPDARAAALGDAIGRLVPALGLRGLNSADFLLREDGFDLIEINPRPGATLDVHPDAHGQLFQQHLDACRGRLPERIAPAAGAAAAAVVYAPWPLAVPAGFAWPDWSADRQPAGAPVAQSEPFCTVRAEAADATSACALLAERGRRIVELVGPA